MPEISVFRNVGEPHSPENIDLLLYLEKTRDGEWEDIVNKVRINPNKEERDALKKLMPTATLSGKFKYRNDISLIEHSEVINIDLDSLLNLDKVREILKKDKYVYSVFMSTSGGGLRVLFRIESAKHREAFKSICHYLYENYGVIADPNGISLSKPYVVSFDPYLHLNEQSLTFKKYIKEKVEKKITNFVHTTSDFDNIISQIRGRNIDIVPGYDEWLKVGFAISEEYGEGGREYYHIISQVSQKYKTIDVDKQYTYCVKARGSGNKVGISSFYYLAKMYGCNITSETTKKIVRTTRNGKKAGLNKEAIIKNLKQFEGISDADEVVSRVFDSADLDYSDDDSDSIVHQLEMFISAKYTLRMNEVNGYLEQNKQPLSPSDLNSIFVAAKKLIPKLDYQLMIRLLKSDFIESYNPFFDFFGSDGIPSDLPAIPRDNVGFSTPLIDTLANSIKNSNPSYTVFFLRKWIVSIVSAAHKVHSPLLLCLLGSQNTGKTEFFRRLLPKELQQYYAESKLDKEKDDELLMTENLIIMDDELGGKTRQDNAKLKNITSKQWFSLRRPYGDHNEKILRLAVLCGTSNYHEILSDPTGNRRIIPIEVDDIDKELYNSIDKKALFMEAYNNYKKGFDWRLGPKDVEFLNIDQGKYEIIVKESELLEKYFDKEDDVRLTTTEILVEIERLTQQHLSVNVIGRELAKCGFEKKSTRNGTQALKKWCVKRINRGASTGDVPF